jgi:hypothetical protein
MSSVRAFVQGDIPQVVALTWRFLHSDGTSPPPIYDELFPGAFLSLSVLGENSSFTGLSN